MTPHIIKTKPDHAKCCKTLFVCLLSRDWPLPLALSNVSNLDLYAHRPAHPPIPKQHTSRDTFISHSGADRDAARGDSNLRELSAASHYPYISINPADKNLDRMPFKIIHSSVGTQTYLLISEHVRHISIGPRSLEECTLGFLRAINWTVKGENKLCVRDKK